MAKESTNVPSAIPVKVPDDHFTLTDFQRNTASIITQIKNRIVTPYQIARRIALGIFAEHKCYRWEVTEEGLLGTYADGRTVLLLRETLDYFVLTCLTDLVLKDIPDEISNHVRHHDEIIRSSAISEEQRRVWEKYESMKPTHDEAHGKPHTIDCGNTFTP